jgi:hypothetical protein
MDDTPSERERRLGGPAGIPAAPRPDADRPGPPADDEDFGEDRIRLYDVETGDPVLTLSPGEDRADVPAFSPDGTRLLAGSERGSAIIWDVRRGQGASKSKE